MAEAEASGERDLAWRWIDRIAVVVVGTIALGIFALLVLSAVLPPSHGTDVSSDPAYAGAIGQRFRTTRSLEASGVTLDRNYAPRVDTVSIEIPPGFSGREVVRTWTIQAGAQLRIIGVREWGFGPLAYTKYVVERLDAPAFAPVPMTLPMDEGQSNFGLDPQLFELLGREPDPTTP